MSTSVDISTALEILVKHYGFWVGNTTVIFSTLIDYIPSGECLTSAAYRSSVNDLYYHCEGYVDDEAMILKSNTDQTYAKVYITFDEQSGDSVLNQYVYWNRVYGTLPTPTRSGYTFDGWFTAASGGTEIISTTVLSTEDIISITLYAQWTLIVATNWTVDTTVVTYDGSVTMMSEEDGCLLDSGDASMDTWITANYPPANYAVGYVMQISHREATLPPTSCIDGPYYATAE